MFKKTWIRPTILFIYIFFSIVLFEITFRVLILDLPINANFYKVVLFSAAYSLFISVFLRFFNQRLLKIFLAVFMLLISVFYFSQTIYYLSMGSFFSFSMAGDAGKGLSFIPHLINNTTWIHLIYILPLLTLFVLYFNHKKLKNTSFDFFYVKYSTIKPLIVSISFAFIVSFLSINAVSSTPFSEEEPTDNIPSYSEKDLFETNFSPELSVNRFGLFTYARIDLRTSLNFTDENERTDAWLQNYFDNREIKSNAYSGMFEDKNLIFITVESLATYSIDSSLTPNLSKMLESSMVFDNYYAPLYYRNTADTEFMMHTSYYPSANISLSMQHFDDNLFTSTLPKAFKAQGKETFAYHNYSDYYYPRDKFFVNTLGFDDYQNAYDMGLIEPGTIDETLEDEQIPWQSDAEMFEATLDELLGKDDFFAYYLTVSGHLPYDESHEIAEKNLSIIEDIFEDENRDPVDEVMMYYYAANYEFDLALGILLDKLDETNQADDTVVIVVGDHYPYGIDRDTIEHFAPEQNIDETRLHIHNVPFFIYHPSLENNHYNHLMSSVDMMPTIGNLFNLDLAYETFFGQDVFSDKFKLIRFQDSSILSDYYVVEADQDLNIIQYDEAYDERRILRHYNEAIHRHQLNIYILETDFFRRIDYKPKP